MKKIYVYLLMSITTCFSHGASSTETYLQRVLRRLRVQPIATSHKSLRFDTSTQLGQRINLNLFYSANKPKRAEIELINKQIRLQKKFSDANNRLHNQIQTEKNNGLKKWHDILLSNPINFLQTNEPEFNEEFNTKLVEAHNTCQNASKKYVELYATSGMNEIAMALIANHLTIERKVSPAIQNVITQTYNELGITTVGKFLQTAQS